MTDWKILLDMDGVLANFHQGVFDMYERNLRELKKKGLPLKYAIHEWLETSEEEMWYRIENSVNFWGYLDPYEWYEQLYALCAAHGEVIISTNPSNDRKAFSQKVSWLQNHLPSHPISNIMIGARKELMANGNHILVDDHSGNIEKFLAHGGKAITFPQIWNDNFSIIDPLLKLDYVREQFKQITADFLV